MKKTNQENNSNTIQNIQNKSTTQIKSIKMENIITFETRMKKIVHFQEGLAGQIFGANKRVLKAIVNSIQSEIESQGKEFIKPWIDTKEIPGSAVVYSEKFYILNKIVQRLKQREEFIIRRNQQHEINNLLFTPLEDPTPTPEEENYEMAMIHNEILKEMDTSFNNLEYQQEEEAYQDYKYIKDEEESWVNHTKYGCEDKFPLYDEETNPFGVYLFTNDYTLSEIFPNTQIVVC